MMAGAGGILMLAVVLVAGEAVGLVRSTDARPPMPVGAWSWTVGKGVNVITNFFNDVSANQSRQLVDLLKDADRGDVLTFKCHGGGDGFEAVADFGRDGALHWFDKRKGEIVDGGLLDAYDPVFTWERKTDRVSTVSLCGKVSVRIYPEIGKEMEAQLERENLQFSMLTLPFPSFAGKVFRIVLRDGRVKDVFFDRGTHLLVEVGKHDPLEITRADIRDYWEIPLERKKEIEASSGERPEPATKEDIAQLRRDLEKSRAEQTQEIKKEIRESRTDAPATWWECAVEWITGPFHKLGGWFEAIVGLAVLLLLIALGKWLGRWIIRIGGYELKPKKRKRK